VSILQVRFSNVAEEGNSMRQKRFWFMMSGIPAVLALALMLPAGVGAASKYKVLHRFTGKPDGAFPFAGLMLDAAGNLYGTTIFGGSQFNAGTVFKLAPNSNGGWTESVLYSFTASADGGSPYADLIVDGAGNLYGTTSGGGSGYGTVFKLTPNSNGKWTESVLYSFSGGVDGNLPSAGLIFDTAGNLYGTTLLGGSAQCRYGCGVVFKLTPNSNGKWTESVLFSGADGNRPSGGVIFDAVGNLYGASSYGGASGDGTVFKLTPKSGGGWTESVLHSFTGGADGSLPTASLILDAGNLYGTTFYGGNINRGCTGQACGVVFKLIPNSDGSWTEQVLHKFENNPAANPNGVLIFDAAGNLYGTTLFGAPVNGGVVFTMAPKSDGSWAFTVLHVFKFKPAALPYAGVILDKAGNLYGTTSSCGDSYGCQGVVFEITP
jgi:uncharacterized repeat protein (TIGR03803 family)